MAASRSRGVRPRGPIGGVADQVEVDARWETKPVVISGFLGSQTARREIRRDDAGWRLDGLRVGGLGHLVDLDFRFTPATNVLQALAHRA